MKKIIYIAVSLLICFYCSMFTVSAQSPQAMKYQTVIRDNNNLIQINKLVAFSISVLSGSNDGTVIYKETQSIYTNEFGVANMEIGKGSVQNGIFANIAWGSNHHFLKIEIDIAGGSNFVFMGTSQLQSVPYSFYADKSGSAMDDHDRDSTNEIQSLQKTGNTVSLSKNGGSFTDSDNQTLSITGNQLQISNGNSVNLTGVVDMDPDPLNEIQTLSLHGDTIVLSKNGGSVLFPNQHTLTTTSNGNNRTVNISGGTGTTFNIADNDSDTLNELQTISKTGNTISLSKNGGSITDSDNQDLSVNNSDIQRTINISNGSGVTFNVADNDNDTVNEIQSITKTGNTISLSKNGGSVTDADNQSLSVTTNGMQRTINISNGTGVTISVADNDSDTTNEIQTISKTGSTISLSKSGGSITDSDNQNLSVTSNGLQRTVNISNGTGITFSVADNDNDSINELQTLSISNDTLFLTNGGFAKLSLTNLLLAPVATVQAATNLQSFSAKLNGQVNANGLISNIVFEWGLTTTYGNTVIPSQSPVIGNSSVPINATLSGLQSATTYHYRIKATNAVNDAYSSDMAFTTSTSVPQLTTDSVSNILSATASCGGNISYSGGANVTARGVCWSINPSPTISGSKTTNGTGTGIFSSSITGLTAATTYYVRAYATNSVGTAYGNEVSFTTAPALASLTTTAATSVTYNTASSGGEITNNGGATVTERGVCWSTTQNPTTAGSKTSDGNGNGIFTSQLSGLSASTTYYVRAYATNSVGTAYGNQQNFTTAPTPLPTVTTTAASSITYTSAISGGNITNNGGSTISQSGICWSTTPNPTTANSKTTDGYMGVFASLISGLTQNTTYYVRAYAVNVAGTAYGNEISFTTLSMIPNVITSAVTSITGGTAICGGNITNDGGATVTQKGVCWDTLPNPSFKNEFSKEFGGTIGTFISTVNHLYLNKTHYIRAYFITSQDTTFGNEISFTTTSTITIGGYFQGGVVAYLLQPGDLGYNPSLPHGIIAAPNDQGSGIWGCSGTIILGADGTAIGTGLQNTIDIVNSCSTAGIAARICYDLVLNGYSDWYLPSINELIQLHNNWSLIGMDYNYYWSSSEINDIKAWHLYVGSSNSPQNFFNKVGSSLDIRAIRNF